MRRRGRSWGERLSCLAMAHWVRSSSVGSSSAPLFGPFEFRRMPYGVHASGFLDHDDMLVEMPDDQTIRVGDCAAAASGVPVAR